MKITKSLYTILLSAPILVLTACSADEPMTEPESESGITTFSITPEVITRDAAATLSVDRLQYSVYDSTGKFLFSDTSDGAPAATTDGNTFTLTLDLVKGRQYRLVFWAVSSQLPDGAYTFDREAGTVTIDYAKVTPNSNVADAYFNTTLRTGGSEANPLTLFRPFTQINVGSSQTLPDGILSQLKIEDVPNVLDLRTGAVSGSVSMSSTLAAPPTDAYPVNQSSTLKYVAMAYVLSTACPLDGATAPVRITKDVTLGYTAAGKSYTKTFPNVPMLYNHRVNIYGSVLDASASDVTVTP